MPDACQLCGGALPKSRQKPKFCSSTCRAGFHEGCRKHTEREFVAGRVTIEQIREARGYG